MDATAMVELAFNWTHLPDQHRCQIMSQDPPKSVFFHASFMYSIHLFFWWHLYFIGHWNCCLLIVVCLAMKTNAKCHVRTVVQMQSDAIPFVSDSANGWHCALKRFIYFKDSWLYLDHLILSGVWILNSNNLLILRSWKWTILHLLEMILFH